MFNGCRLSFVSSLLFLCLIVFNVISVRFCLAFTQSLTCAEHIEKSFRCSAQLSNYVLNNKSIYICFFFFFFFQAISCSIFLKKGKNTDDAPEV